MAATGFKGIGWFLCGVIVAPACYLVTSQVAAERAELAAMNSAIARAHQDIRDLEIEFATRANLVQLAQWNGEALQMAAPDTQQFLAGPQALASLDAGSLGEIQSAVVPAAIIRATAQTAAPQPAVAASSVERRADAAPAATPRSQPTPAAPRQRPPEGAVRYASAQRTVEQRSGERPDGRAMAMLEDRLLSAETLATLQARAQIERASLQ